MALTKVAGDILDPGIAIAGVVTATAFDGPFRGGSGNHIIAGIITATSLDLNGSANISNNLVVEGNLTANGDFTTLNTTLREVELLRVDTNSSAAAGIITQTGSGDLLRLYDGTSQVVTVDDTGFVGIGTNAPAVKLDVYRNDAGLGNIVNIEQGGSGDAVLGFAIKGTAAWQFGIDNSDSDKFKISYDGSGLDSSTSVTLDRTGKVGIGTDVPHQLLDVKGNAVFGPIQLAGNPGANTGIATVRGHFVNAVGDFARLYFSNSVSSGGTVGASAYISGKRDGISGSNWSAGLAFYTDSRNPASNSPIERMVIGSTGNVGIASAIPQAKLDVNGDVKVGSGITFHATNSRISLPDGTTGSPYTGNLEIGSGRDFTIVHDSHHTYMTNRTGNFYIGISDSIFPIQLKSNNTAEIYHGSTKVLNTTSTGVQIDTILKLYGDAGNPGKLQLAEGGAVSEIRVERSTDTSSSLLFDTEISGTTATRWKIDTAGHLLTASAGAYDIGTASAEIGNIYIADDKKIFLGNEQDVEMYHSNHLNINFIKKSGTGAFNIDLDGDFVIRASNGNERVKCTGPKAAVELYHTGSPKLATTTTGIDVTGEVAASQDYPNFRPTLDLNFAAEKKLDPRITYSRSGPASFVNEFGNIVFVGDNVPRFDHDPVTRECKGLLLEEQRSNDVANSQNVGGYSGGYMNGGTFTYPDDVVAPDGSTKGVLKMVSDTSTGYHGVQYQISGFGSNENWAYQVWVKAVSNSQSVTDITLYDNAQSGATNNGSIRLNLTTGAVPYNGNSGEIVAYNNGWYQIKIKGTRATTNANSSMLLVLYNGSTNSFAGDGSSGFYVWGGQYENDTHIWTSFIPTYGTTASRGYEATTLEGTEFSDVFGTEFKEFSLVADYDNTQTDDGPQYGIIDLWGESAGYDDRIEWMKDNASPYHIETRSFGQGNATFGNGTLSASSKAKSQRFATSWYVPDYSNTSSRRFVVSMGGEAVDVISDSSGTTVPQITRMGIGCNPTRLDFSPGVLHFKRLMVYNKTLSDGQLQNLSA